MPLARRDLPRSLLRPASGRAPAACRSRRVAFAIANGARMVAGIRHHGPPRARSLPPADDRGSIGCRHSPLRRSTANTAARPGPPGAVPSPRRLGRGDGRRAALAALAARSAGRRQRRRRLRFLQHRVRRTGRGRVRGQARQRRAGRYARAHASRRRPRTHPRRRRRPGPGPLRSSGPGRSGPTGRLLSSPLPSRLFPCPLTPIHIPRLCLSALRLCLCLS